jgi:adhesin transport system membrane fusion protein
MANHDHFLADISIQNLKSPKRSTHLILLIIAIFLIIAFIWAHYSLVDEVTRGEGKVIPSSQIQVIQNLEGGIIEKIFVKEGEIVQKGQILVKLNDTRFLTDYDEFHHKALALEIKIARLTAEASGTEFKPSETFIKELPATVKTEQAIFVSRTSQFKELKSNLEMAQKELSISVPLVSKGAVSEVEILRLKREISQLQGQLDDFKTKMLNELTEATEQYNSSNQDALANLDRLKRTTIRSPVKGIIKQIKITTIGGVSQPGADIMEIVPLEDTLLIEAKVLPKDIGFIHLGQKAMIKIAAYDYSIYGGLPGKVETISADTLTDDKGVSYFLVRVRTNKNYLMDRDHTRLYIIPGMTATMEILTGKKSILHYILKPIMKAKHEAFKER